MSKPHCKHWVQGGYKEKHWASGFWVDQNGFRRKKIRRPTKAQILAWKESFFFSIA